MKRIQVAVGLLFDDLGRVLVNNRLVTDQYFQKWEFPGGKLEQGETAPQALLRELKEELGIDVIKSEMALFLEFDYPDRHVALHVQQVIEYEGEPKGVEGQAIKWVRIDQLQDIDLLQGNKAIIDFLAAKKN